MRRGYLDPAHEKGKYQRGDAHAEDLPQYPHGSDRSGGDPVIFFLDRPQDGIHIGGRKECKTEALQNELIDLVRKEIGPIAKPDAIQWSPGLPKTRSGKIMRRILRKIAANDLDNLGDISTLADPGVVEELKANRISI